MRIHSKKSWQDDLQISNANQIVRNDIFAFTVLKEMVVLKIHYCLDGTLKQDVSAMRIRQQAVCSADLD